MSIFFASYPIEGGGGGVTSLNGLTGALTLVAGTGITITPSGSNITIAATNGGTVTSVGLADDTGLFNITGSPVTSAGTLTLASLQSQVANTFFAAPNGSSGAPTFRAIAAADLPNLSGTYVTQSEVGAANGVASLDGSGKVPVGQLPSVVMEYQGSWDPSTNTPALSDGTGANGNVYYVSVAYAGTVPGNTDPSMYNFQIGDLVIYSASVGKWQLVTPAAGVQSVNGAQGAVIVNAINQLTGDGTAGPASGSQSQVLTLATVNANVGSFTNANITVNAKGLITAASSGTAVSGFTYPTSMSAVGGGNGTLPASMTGASNTLIGQDVGLALTSGSTNTLLGNIVGIALTTGTDNILIGYDVASHLTSGTNNVVIGDNAGGLLNTGTDNTLIGRGAYLTADVNGTVLIGTNTQASSPNSMAIGPGACVANSSIVLGPNNGLGSPTDSASFQFVVGSPDLTISDFFLGRGAIGDGTPANCSIQPSPVVGTDITGGDLTIRAGNGVGTGGSGRIIFQVAPPAASGSTPNTLATSFAIADTGALLFAGSAGTSGYVLTSNGTNSAPTWQPGGMTGTVTSVAMSVPAFLSVSGSPITSSGTLAVTLSGTALPVANGGTGDTSLTAYALLAGGITSTGSIQSISGVGTSGQGLISNGAGALPTWQTFVGAALVAPTVQKFLSGSGTYTLPTGPRTPLYIRVRMVGGGGGGAGSGSGASSGGGAGGTGGASTFGSSLLVANGGSGGVSGGSAGPVGGTASLGSGPTGIALSGAGGTPAFYANAADGSPGGPGASSPFGGAGYGGTYNTTAGGAAVANSGSGGGGGGGSSSVNFYNGGGGAAAGFVDAIIYSPSSVFSYAVGAGGTAGTAGTLGAAGGLGGSGMIIVEEFYQ